MKKTKLIVFFLCLCMVCPIIKVSAQFPWRLNLMNPTYCNGSGCNTQSSTGLQYLNGYKISLFHKNITETGTTVGNIQVNDKNFVNSLSSNTKALLGDESHWGYEYKTLTVICTNYHKKSPIGGGVDQKCYPITDSSADGYWDDGVKAGVGSILKNVLDATSNYTTSGFIVTNGSMNSTNATNYYDASLAIAQFAINKGVKGVSLYNEYSNYITNKKSSTWLQKANQEYDLVNNMSVSIGSVTSTQDDDAFYLTIPVVTSDKYTTTITTEPSSERQANGTYKILKSSLSEGSNTISITANVSYVTYIAQNYGCGTYSCDSGTCYYQSLTPILIEPKEFKKSTTKKINLTKESKGDLTINIVNQRTKNLILNETATFTIHNGTGCVGEQVDKKSTSLGTTGKINLTGGTYSIKEVAPYINSNNYKRVSSTNTNCVVNSITVPAGGKITANVEYSPQCEVRLTEIKSKYETGTLSEAYIRELLDLYNDYSNNTNLLNFSDPFCTKAEKCNNDLVIGCLSATTLSTFSERDLSCYDDPIQDKITGDYLGFCQTNYTLTNNIGTSVFYGKSGRLLIEQSGGLIKIFEKNSLNELVEKNITNQYISTANTTKTCYTIGDQSIDNELNTYNVYFGDNNNDGTADELLVEPITPTPTSVKENVSYGFIKHTLTHIKNYKLKGIYLEKMTGKYSSSQNDKTTGIIYGLLSRFDKNNGVIPFRINDTSSNSCTYETEPEIIDPGLELEFRTIDTKEPFNRRTMSNWSNGIDNSKDNDKVKQYIQDAVNSYGLDKNGKKVSPAYKITLTPDLIKNIRAYNNGTGSYTKAHPYDDYEVCQDTATKNCESKNAFIDKYIKEGVIEKQN